MLLDLPKSRLLLETDGPFVKNGNRIVGPGEVANAALALAGLRKMPLQACVEAVRTNLKTLVTD